MKRLILFVFVIIAFTYATPASAALYYEFNPDYAQSLLVASSDTLSEVFLPLNEFLSGFDFWLSNDNQTGTATFMLYNAAGTQLAQRVATIPAIVNSDSGTRFHVNLPSQLSVTGTAVYRVQISSVMPTLRLYYADQNQLLAHNGAPTLAYSAGLARIGDEDKGFSFKFALFENNESAPPILSNVVTSQETVDRVILTFNVNEPVDYQVQYGSELVTWNGSYTSCLPTIQTCTVYLSVSPDTTYDYMLTVRDVWGNTSASNGTFTSLAGGQTPTPTPSVTPTITPTPSASSSPQASQSQNPTPTPTPDTVPPVLTNARVVNATTSAASFAWTSNEAANSTVVVQLTPELITVGGNSDGTLELEHLITVSNLSADTYYQATITSSDASANTSAVVLTFLSPNSVPTATPTQTPTPSDVGATPTIVPSGPTDNPTITWSVPPAGEPTGGYRIDVFDANNKLIKTITVPAGTHDAQLAGLTSGTNRIVVYANRDGVFEKVSAPVTVSITKKPLLERLLSSAPYFLVGLILAVGFAVVLMKLHKPKPLVIPSASIQMPGV